jgi:hypothetical protein
VLWEEVAWLLTGRSAIKNSGFFNLDSVNLHPKITIIRERGQPLAHYCLKRGGVEYEENKEFERKCVHKTQYPGIFVSLSKKPQYEQSNVNGSSLEKYRKI